VLNLRILHSVVQGYSNVASSYGRHIIIINGRDFESFASAVFSVLWLVCWVLLNAVSWFAVLFFYLKAA